MAQFYTFNATALPNAKECKLDNGTLVYYNKPGLDCSCLAPISSSPDFGGVAIIVAFLSMSFVTIAISTIPTVYSVSRQWKQTHGPKRFWKWLCAIVQFEENHVERPSGRVNYPPRFSIAVPNGHPPILRSNSVMTDEGSDSKQPLPASKPYNNLEEDEPLACTWARKVLFKLCDIQIITGTAMMIAALADHESLSFYDAQLASQYWWLCLNSWWTSRIDYSRNDKAMSTWRAQARRISIFVSVALSIVLQIIITVREQYDWDPLQSNSCYIADSTGTSFAQNVLWLGATSLFLLVITISLFPVSRDWFDRHVNSNIAPSITYMNKKVQSTAQEFQDCWKTRSESSVIASIARGAKLLILALKVVSTAICWLSWTILIMASSILVSGNSPAFIEMFVFSGVYFFLLWWIIFLKLKNKALQQGPEDAWTFGSALICLLFLLVFFHGLDVFASVKREQHLLRRKKRDEEAQEVMESDASNINDFAFDGAMKELEANER